MVSSVDAVCLPLRMHAANTPYYFPNRSRRCRKQTILGFIHRTTWNRCSRKFISKIVHSLTPVPLKTPAPGTLHSPAPIPLVTPMDRYARSWMRSCCRLMFVVERERPPTRPATCSFAAGQTGVRFSCVRLHKPPNKPTTIQLAPPCNCSTQQKSLILIWGHAYPLRLLQW